MCHPYSVWLHGMAGIVGVIPDICVVEVGDFFWGEVAIGVERLILLDSFGHDGEWSAVYQRRVRVEASD